MSLVASDRMQGFCPAAEGGAHFSPGTPMTPRDDNRFLCACTATLIRLSGLDPAACRAFVADFEPLFLHLSRRLADPVAAARSGAVMAYAAMVGGREGELRRGRSCRAAAVLGQRLATAVARETGGEEPLARLARATLARARAGA